ANCPVLSGSGLSEAGVSKAHCHQPVARCEGGGYCARMMFATIVKASAKAPVLIFIRNVVFISSTPFIIFSVASDIDAWKSSSDCLPQFVLKLFPVRVARLPFGFVTPAL